MVARHHVEMYVVVDVPQAVAQVVEAVIPAVVIRLRVGVILTIPIQIRKV